MTGGWVVSLLLVVVAMGSPLPSRADIMVANGALETGVATFRDGASGNASPVRQVRFAGLQPNHFAVDPVRGEMFLPGLFDDRVVVAELDASGTAGAPSRLLVGGETGLCEPTATALDLVHDELWVLNRCGANGNVGALTVYPRAATGNTPPLRSLTGPLTGLVTGVYGVAVDPLHDEVFVSVDSAVGGEILVFSRTAAGDVAPKRRLRGAKTRLGTPNGLVLDLATDELYVSDQQGAVSVFARTAAGNVAPLRRIAGDKTLLADETGGLALLNGDELAVALAGNSGFDFSDDSILVFPRQARGNVAPRRRINGSATGLNGPVGLEVHRQPLVLGGGRFLAEVTYGTAGGSVGSGTPVAITPDTGYFWFFGTSNVELLVKVLDGCATNGRFWVFAGGLTNLRVTLQVTDLATGTVRRYDNAAGEPFAPIQDVDAFASCGVNFPSGSAAGARGVAAAPPQIMGE
jgi:hypothetical protein